MGYLTSEKPTNNTQLPADPVAYAAFMQNMDNELSIRLARQDFWEFCLWWDRPFFEKRPFLRQVAYVFQEVYENYVFGISLTVSISMPPRAGKSYITSLFSVWWIGKFPKHSVMRNTCTATLYRKFSWDCRKFARDPRYLKVFPHIQIEKFKQNLDGWYVEGGIGPAYFGAGVGGTIIGFGANIAMTDDLYPGMEQALSGTYQDSVHMWKEGTHDSRKEKNCPEIFIGTRWSLTDEIGRAHELGLVNRSIRVPALVVNKEGKLVTFCEAVKSTEDYLLIKKNTASMIWAAEYMQDPEQAEGMLFTKDRLNFYDPNSVDLADPDYKHVQIDPADDGGDFLAKMGLRIVGQRVYVEHVMFNRLGVDITQPSIVKYLLDERIDGATIEGNGGWKNFGRRIREDTHKKFEHCDIRIIHNSVPKATRIIAESAYVLNYFYFRNDHESIPEYAAFMKNLMAYRMEGGNKNDDAPDCAVGAAKAIRLKFPELW